jgi:hypothetical protein
MSAYHVGTDHINALISYATEISMDRKCLSEERDCTLSWEKIGQALSTENDNSINYRYSENITTPYRYERDESFIIQHTALDVIKMIGCYEYQSCEHPEWEHSLAKRFCSSLKALAVTKIPGYEEAIRDYKKPLQVEQIIVRVPFIRECSFNFTYEFEDPKVGSEPVIKGKTIGCFKVQCTCSWKDLKAGTAYTTFEDLENSPYGTFDKFQDSPKYKDMKEVAYCKLVSLIRLLGA